MKGPRCSALCAVAPWGLLQTLKIEIHSAGGACPQAPHLRASTLRFRNRTNRPNLNPLPGVRWAGDCRLTTIVVQNLRSSSIAHTTSPCSVQSTVQCAARPLLGAPHQPHTSWGPLQGKSHLSTWHSLQQLAVRFQALFKIQLCLCRETLNGSKEKAVALQGLKTVTAPPSGTRTMKLRAGNQKEGQPAINCEGPQGPWGRGRDKI